LGLINSLELARSLRSANLEVVYYDPQTGRYLTSDPIGLVGGLNPYLYAEANPVGQIDPMGLYALPGAIYGSISGAVGGYITGGWVGVIPGAMAGAAYGLVVPASSSAIGATVGGITSSILGQIAGNAIQNRSILSVCNYNAPAAVAAGVAGVPAMAFRTIIAARMPLVTLEVVGKPLGSRVVFRIPGNTVGSAVEGAVVGAGEKLGSDL